MPLGGRYKSLSQNRRNPLRAFHTDRASGPERLATPFYSRRLNVLAEAANRRPGHWSTLSRSAYLRAYRVEERMDSTASNSNYQGAISAIVPALPRANVLRPPMLWAARRRMGILRPGVDSHARNDLPHRHQRTFETHQHSEGNAIQSRVSAPHPVCEARPVPAIRSARGRPIPTALRYDGSGWPEVERSLTWLSTDEA